MKANVQTHLSLGMAMAALLAGMAASAQNSFDKAPIAPQTQPVSQLQAQAPEKPACPPSRADRWGGCRGKDYNGPIGDWGDPEYDDRHGRFHSAGEKSHSAFANPARP